MKLLGHAWVAVNSYPKGNRDFLIIGSILPEIMYYTRNHPFQYEEIHEGGVKLYKYLKKENPKLKDLGIGMIAHSNTYGADYFNIDENLKILGYKEKKKEEMRNKLIGVLKINYETSKTRAHNILDIAVEVGIAKRHPEFVDEFEKVINDKIIINETTSILSECFNKSRSKVSKALSELIKKAKGKYSKGSIGMAKLWTELVKDLDPKPDIPQLAQYLEKINNDFKGKDKIFVRKSIIWTKGNLEKLI